MSASLVQSVIDKLKKEISTKNREDCIADYEEILADNIENVSKTPKFYNLPLKNILSVVSQVDFSSIDDSVSIIKLIISNTIQFFSENKETIFLLHSIHCKDCSWCLDDILHILQSFTNVEILSMLNDLDELNETMPTRDYEYDFFQQKTKNLKI